MSYGSNFATGPARRLPVVHVPTQWQLLLRDLGLTEQDAHGLLKRTGAKALRLRLWIQSNYRRRYIPVRFLTAEQIEAFLWD
jgi:hypothetical protein